MATVLAGEEAVAEVVARKPHLLAVAAVNGPRQTVLSGAASTLDEALAELSARGVQHRPLPAERAFHSPLVDAALD
jgi:acyl transferase domain-containing protein